MKSTTNMLSKLFILTISTFFILCSCEQTETFPDGSPVSDWFKDDSKIELNTLGKVYDIKEHGAVDDGTTMNTVLIQSIIDKASAEGGGVIVVPEGKYLSGALFFKPGTHLHVKEGGVLLGSDTITDFPIRTSRIEGQNLDYFPALVNAYNVNGFTISGKGTIDGQGLRYWKAFWRRRQENPKCTNLEVSRPRLVFIWGCNDVHIQDVKLHNTGFWTTHLYKCNNVKILDVHIYSPKEPVPAPSSDAIDLDVCSNVHIKGCYMSVNDDAVALKGGKGPWADADTNNGPNMNIIIEDCEFGWCHAVFTCGSESIHSKNIIVRNCTVDGANRLIFLKMRPDTPQKYEYITLENIKGSTRIFMFIKPWRQFFDLKGRETPPVSSSEHITFKNIELECKHFAEVGITEYDALKNFTLENVNVKSETNTLDVELFENIEFKNVIINGSAYNGK